MDKVNRPQQLSLTFDKPEGQSRQAHEAVSVVSERASSSIGISTSAGPLATAAILDFQSVAAKRSATKQASLYQRILDSVRHIG